MLAYLLQSLVYAFTPAAVAYIIALVVKWIDRRPGKEERVRQALAYGVAHPAGGARARSRGPAVRRCVIT